MEELINFSKQYGYIFQGSEIYGGLSNTYDYGPLGALLKNNIKNAYIQKFVREDNNNVLIDAAIFMNPKVWEASGHLETFNDPLLDCRNCKTRHRADKLIEDLDDSIEAGGWTDEEYKAYIEEHDIKCPKCGKQDFTDIRKFNLMFKTHQGVTEESQDVVYLRPETAQGIFVNFKNVQRSMRLRVPFGIAQIGKSFRNEITPGNFIFRMREFEQMELQFFLEPGNELKWLDYYEKYTLDFLKTLGLKEENLRIREHTKEELSMYSNKTIDIEYKYPFGFGELWGIASRTDYDLSKHTEYSGEDMSYQDPHTNEKYIPYVIEPSVGVDRLFLSILNEAYTKEEVNGEERLVLRLHPYLAPYKAAILPLSRKHHSEKANEVYRELAKHFDVTYDETASIGRRYRRQDAAGTPFAITIDDETTENNTVTVRYRDTMKQDVINVDEIINFINEKTTL